MPDSSKVLLAKVSLIKLYWVSETNVCNCPPSILAISTKFWSLKSFKSFFAKLIDICNLSAPGAAKFVYPDALSFNDGSSSAVINFSSMLNPIRYDGWSPYWSNIRVSLWTCAKVPRRK